MSNICKISKSGFLWIKRAGEYKIQQCPFTPRDRDFELSDCGDWCPLFGEPEYDDKNDSFDIPLCKCVISDVYLTDERGHNDAEGNIDI